MRVEINKITGTKESKPSDIRMTDWTVNNWEKWKEGIEFNMKRGLFAPTLDNNSHST